MEERKKHFERPSTHRPPSLVNLTIVAVILGIVAGGFGYLMSKSVWPIKDIDYLNLINNQQEVKVSLEQPFVNIASKYKNSVAGIYTVENKRIDLDQAVFPLNKFLGSAIVVTSDGWLMTTDQMNITTSLKVILEDEIYDIEEIKEDEFSNTLFIKIDASYLQPVNFQLTSDIQMGEAVFTNIDTPSNFKHSFYSSTISNNHYSINQYLSTDELDYYIQLDNVQEYLSSPYFNMNGNLVGLSYTLNKENMLIPAEYLKQAVKHLLDNTERVELGIRYLDMENNSGFIRKGNLVYHPSLRAVEYNSVGYIAGLKAGDQIVSVNNEIISSTNTLTSILQNYRIGDTVTFKILRNEVEQDTEVVL